jgi:hypothetical protein
MAKQYDPGVPGQAEVSATAAPATTGLLTVAELGRLTGNITRRRRVVHFGGAAGGAMDVATIAHRAAAQLHGWTDDFKLTRDSYEQALKAAMPESVRPTPPQAPPHAVQRDPAKRRELSKAAAAAAPPRAPETTRTFMPHQPAVNREVMK